MSKATVDTLAFRSGGDGAAKALAIIAESGGYADEELLASGLFVAGDGGVQANPIYTRRNILIPYLDEVGHCSVVRPHKGGPKGHPVRIYAPRFTAKGRTKEVVVVEGEFGAAALRQVGIRAISVPGVSSFAGTNLPRLVAWLRTRDVNEITVLFDREDKADPHKDGYKADALKRHDTEYWAWRMAHDLGENGIETRIATLPLAWDPERAKVDADSALALGKGWDHFMKVIRAGVPPKDYLRQGGHTPEALRTLSRKIANHLLLDARQVVDGETYERGYRIRKGGVLREDFEDRSSRGVRRKAPVRVSQAPIWVSGQGFDVETRQQYIELSYVRSKDGVQVMDFELVERGAAMSGRRLVEYAGIGLPVSSTTASRMVDYLSRLEAVMAPYLPTSRFTDRNGWHASDGVRQFVLAEETIALIELVFCSPEACIPVAVTRGASTFTIEACRDESAIG